MARKLNIAFINYDRTRALAEGSVKIDGVDANFHTARIVTEIFEGMIRRRAYDVSELGMSYFLRTFDEDGRSPFVANPVFPNRAFRHGGIYINKASGIESPEHLAGKRIGELGLYGHDAGIMQKGMLSDEFGVRPEQNRWIVGGIDFPMDPVDFVPHPSPPGVEVEWADKGTDLGEMLETGEVDALFSADIPSSVLENSPNVGRLFEDYQAAEANYFRRNGIFPIMHTVVVARELADEHPDVVRSVYQGFCAAKKSAQDRLVQGMTFNNMDMMMPWFTPLIEADRALLGDDWWPYGIERNRAAINAVLRYHYEQGVTKRRFTIEDIFLPELRRNAATRSGGLEYRASTAQWHAERSARRPKRAKLAINVALRAYVQDRLAGQVVAQDGAAVDGPIVRWKGRRHGPRQKRRWGMAWSPEQIARRLQHDFPGDETMQISHEAIYQALYVQGRGALRRELTACLRTGRALRVPRARARGWGKSFVGPEVMISERPAEADDRAVPGHWEGDLILGLQSSAIGTLVERTTRFTMLLHLPPMDGHGPGARVKNGPALAGHGAAAVRDAITRTITTLPEQLRRSLTWDQGAELSQHAQLRIDTGVQIYFCDPHSPWQRGTNENTNGLLRQYFPKGTDLSLHSAGALAAVATTLNGRPRKTLGWRTPAEALNEQMKSAHTDVATTG